MPQIYIDNDDPHEVLNDVQRAIAKRIDALNDELMERGDRIRDLEARIAELEARLEQGAA